MKKKLLYVAVFVAGLALGALGIWLSSPGGPGASVLKEEIGEVSRLRGEITTSSETGKKTYKATSPRFSLSYPGELLVKEFDEGRGATTIVFQGPGENNGFQLFTVPYSGAQISEERIQQDLKGGTMKDAKEVVIGGGNTRAILFTSESPMVGETREVWFIKDGYLYEATAYASWEAKLGEALSTISFE